jgi:hemerythrin-like domain-containing protein
MTKRYPTLIPLTHDHHHALAHARQLRVVAQSGEEDRLLAQADTFFRFFHEETITHFREEEEMVFPLAVGDERATPLLTQVMLEHLRLHALVALLGAAIDEGQVSPDSARDLADLLERHIRLEEGKVFPLLEEIVPSDLLDGLALSARKRAERPPS